MKFVVDKDWLLTHLQDNNFRIVDCRFSLANPEQGNEEYHQGHIPGAVYFDLDKDLSGTVVEHGGRHPLPKLDEFKEKLEQFGISEEMTIVAYDNGEGAFAARFWWMLTYLGHQNVYVLNGGYKAWINAEFPVTTEVPFYEKSHFSIRLQPHLLADVDEVKKVVADDQSTITLIDSREPNRYLGIEEPIDKKKGHIPGAVNKPWMEGYHDGYFSLPSVQMQRFADLNPNQPVIVYCGSGVTAVPNFLALKEAGFEHVKLYLGSFSDWITYEENKVE